MRVVSTYLATHSVSSELRQRLVAVCARVPYVYAQRLSTTTALERAYGDQVGWASRLGIAVFLSRLREPTSREIGESRHTSSRHATVCRETQTSATAIDVNCQARGAAVFSKLSLAMAHAFDVCEIEVDRLAERL